MMKLRALFCRRIKLLEKWRSSRNPKHYCVYLATEDPLYRYMLAMLIKKNINKHQDSKHLLVPQFGIRLWENPKSKYPLWLKKTVLFLRYCSLERNNTGNMVKDVKTWLNKDDAGTLDIVSYPNWLYFLIREYIKSIFVKDKYTKFADVSSLISSFESNLGHFNGDLVADTFIRYRGKPWVNLESDFLKDIIIRHFALEKFWSVLFNNKNGYFFAQFSTYIHHGVPLRTAVSKGYKAATFAYSSSFFKTHILQHPWGPQNYPRHVADHSKYVATNSKLLNAQTLDKARKNLENRCSGIYDNSMSYMKDMRGLTGNTFTNYQANYMSDINDHVLILLHDFFDSAHVYEWMIFDDFWDWITSTLKYCKQKNLKVAIKPHPNEIPESKQYSELLFNCLSYMGSEVKRVPTDIPNNVLFQMSPSVITTVYGSVAAEAAFCGLTAVLAGDHPAINFDFCTTATTRAEYFDLLLNPPRTQDQNKLKMNASLFVAQHYKSHLENEGNSLRSRFNIKTKDLKALHKKLTKADVKHYCDSQLQKLLDALEMPVEGEDN